MLIPASSGLLELGKVSQVACPSNRGNREDKRGETLHKFVNTIWHFDFGLRINRLAELHQIYLIP